jgi:hypothetical protein
VLVLTSAAPIGDGYNFVDMQRQFCEVVQSSRKIIPLTSGFAGACVTRDSQVTATTALILTSATSIWCDGAELSYDYPFNECDLQVRVHRQLSVVVRSSFKIIPLTSGSAGACVTWDSQVTATTALILTIATSILRDGAELL